MDPSADELIADYSQRGQPGGREYFHFALLLIALLLIASAQVGLSSQAEHDALPSNDSSAIANLR